MPTADKAFLSSAAWRKFRKEVLAAHPICQAPGCGKPSTDVDHAQSRRRGGAPLDKRNAKALCHSHHSSKTAQVDGGFGRPLKHYTAAITRGIGADGQPLDPNHPWHRKTRGFLRKNGVGGP